MSYSRRQLEAFGEPLGESATRLKEGGFGRIYGGGGGGGGQSPVQQQTQISDLPDWAKGYAQNVLAKGQALTSNAYQPYTQQRIAGFTPLQEQAFQGAANLGPTQQTALGSGLAAAAGTGGLGQNYQAGQFSGGRFTPGAAQAYMNPYVQSSLAPQMELMRQQQGQQGTQMASQATQAGAFGGSRFGIAQAQQNLNNQLAQQNLVGQGYNTAFQQAQNQFNQDMARRMQAQQLGEQSRQFGANLGLQGLQTGLQAAGTLGTLGQQQFAQQQGAMQAQSAAGAQQQALEQKGLDTAYQDYLTQLNYPYQQLSYMSNLIRGTPMGMSTQSQVYQAPGNMLGQLAGLGMMGYSASKAFASGGDVKGYAGDEGSVTSEGFERSQLSRMSPQQLDIVKHNALMRRDLPLAQLVDEVMAENRSLEGGLGGAFGALPQNQQDNVVQAAGGGILAFSGEDKSDVKDPDYKPTQSYWEQMGNVLGLIPTGLKHLVSAPGYGFSDSAPSGNKTASISDYARGQDSTDAEAINANAKYPSTSKDAGTKTGARTPGATATPAPTKEISFADDVATAKSLLTNPQDAEDRKALNDLIAQYGTRAGDLKSQGFNDFLMNYGSALAQSAAQPGMGTGLQGALRSAAAAAPAGAKSIMDTRSAIARAQDTNLKMQLEMRKYNIAESKNDRATMVSAAQNIRMMRQQQAQLNEVIRHNQASEGLMRQRLSATGGAGLQKAYMAGMSQAQNRASKEAMGLWKDPLERSKLEKAGIKSYDQLLQQRMQQHMKSAIPIYGVTAAGEEDED